MQTGGSDTGRVVTVPADDAALPREGSWLQRAGLLLNAAVAVGWIAVWLGGIAFGIHLITLTADDTGLEPLGEMLALVLIGLCVVGIAVSATMLIRVWGGLRRDPDRSPLLSPRGLAVLDLVLGALSIWLGVVTHQDEPRNALFVAGWGLNALLLALAGGLLLASRRRAPG